MSNLTAWALTGSDALGTGVRLKLLLGNQRLARPKLLQVVDLDSYRVSTSATAIAAGARGEAPF